MKPLLLFFGLFIFYHLAAQKNGYYVTLENDTTPAFIHLRKDVFGPYSRFGIQEAARISKDSLAAETVFKPGDIKSFFVKGPMGDYSFYSKPVGENKLRFMEAVVCTPETSLYSYRTLRLGGRLGASEGIHYTIEKSDSNYLYIFNRNHVKLKKRLREFYAGNEKILTTIEPLFKQPGFVDRDLLLLFNRIKGLP